MLKRKIAKDIEAYLKSDSNKILLVDGARQIGKTYIINEVGRRLFDNFIEINFAQDSITSHLFENIGTVEDFYLQVSALAGEKMKDKKNTLIFIDEIQTYPSFLTLLKFLKKDDRYTYIASGSLLGVALSQTNSIPIGSIQTLRMYPLDFEEWLYANGVGEDVVLKMKEAFKNHQSLSEPLHNRLMDLFKKYLIVGGMPDAINSYLETKNIWQVRNIQKDIHNYYSIDASKYDEKRKLKIRRIYEMIPSNLENKKKRIVVKNIENKKGKRFSDYEEEFEYLINLGITLEVKAISNPCFPLIESSSKNLLKLYLNDVGILTNILYKNNIKAILENEESINLGTVYESVVAQELAAHNHKLFYYDNKAKGEVDFLVDDYDNLCVCPLEIKSGKDYKIHNAIDTFLSNKNYKVKYGYVFSNQREVEIINSIIHMPIYYVMFI